MDLQPEGEVGVMLPEQGENPARSVPSCLVWAGLVLAWLLLSLSRLVSSCPNSLDPACRLVWSCPVEQGDHYSL